LPSLQENYDFWEIEDNYFNIKISIVAMKRKINRSKGFENMKKYLSKRDDNRILYRVNGKIIDLQVRILNFSLLKSREI